MQRTCSAPVFLAYSPGTLPASPSSRSPAGGWWAQRTCSNSARWVTGLSHHRLGFKTKALEDWRMNMSVISCCMYWFGAQMLSHGWEGRTGKAAIHITYGKCAPQRRGRRGGRFERTEHCLPRHPCSSWKEAVSRQRAPQVPPCGFRILSPMPTLPFMSLLINEMPSFLFCFSF